MTAPTTAEILNVAPEIADKADAYVATALKDVADEDRPAAITNLAYDIWSTGQSFGGWGSDIPEHRDCTGFRNYAGRLVDSTKGAGKMISGNTIDPALGVIIHDLFTIATKKGN